MDDTSYFDDSLFSNNIDGVDFHSTWQAMHAAVCLTFICVMICKTISDNAYVE